MAAISITGDEIEGYTYPAAKPTASIGSGMSVHSGTAVTFATTTPGAALLYENGTDNWVALPGGGLTVTGNVGDTVTFRVKATAAGIPDSPVLEVTYTIMATVLNLNEAIAVPDNTNVTVQGQLAYRFGNYDGMNSAILQDDISGKRVSLQIYSSLDDYEIGDILQITGRKTTYGAVPQVQGITNVEVITPASSATLLAPVEFDDFATLKAAKADYVSAVVLIKNVTLGTYSSSASTTLTDENMETMPIYRAATFPFEVEAGEVVNVLAVLSKYNATDQLRTGTPGANGDRAIYEVVTDTKPPVITLPGSFPNAKVGESYTISVDVKDNKGVASVSLNYKIGSGNLNTASMSKNADNGEYEYTIPASALTENGNITFTVSAVDVTTLTATSAEKVIVISDVPILLSSQPAMGSATGADKRPRIAAEFSNAGAGAQVKLTLAPLDGSAIISNATMTDEGSGVFSYTSLNSDLVDGKYKATVSVLRSGETTATDFEWIFTAGESTFNAYFGQLHSHTGEYSDGTGTLAQALDYIKDTASRDNVDFVAFTDHSNYFDATGTGNNNPAAALHDKSQMTAASLAKWNKYVGDMRAFNAEGHDVLAIPGFEMTWSGGPGHINTFNTEGLVSRNNTTLNNKTNDSGMKAYYEELKNNPDSISQFNHPGTTFGTFANFSYWDPAIDELITMIEVGNGEGGGIGSGYFPSYEYYVQALDKGWHIAPANNQDNHKGKWGNSNTMRSVVITDDFSEAGMLAGMRNMTMYSTEDKNLEIMYTVNDMIMGSIISGTPASLAVFAEINDPDGEAIGTVEIVVNGGRVVHQERITDSAATLNFTLAPNYSYYFLRVIQPDKDIAVTAPVWIGETVKAGITEITTTAIMPLKNQAIPFKTAIYNYEGSDLIINKIEYSITHLGSTTVVDTVTNSITVPSNTQAHLIDFNYTPDKLGVMTLGVKVDASIGGVEYNYESSYLFEVLDPDKIVPIAIDAGHSNFYVSGNYANSDANFIEMCNKSGVQVTRLQAGELTYNNIKDMALLVLTVPFKSGNTPVTDSLYSAAEIAAIKQYADNGGNLLITSKSDRQEPPAANEKANVITNEILTAIGAKARVAEAIVVDPVRRANEAFRITLGGDSVSDRLCFNYGAMSTEPLADLFLRDVEETTNNTFSAYNSAPIIANGATVIVTGFPETTYGTKFSELSSNQVPSGGSTVITSAGNTHLLVAETLAGGGFLITSGVTFFSTFEVKVDLDNQFDKQNSNYQIVQNILDAINPTEISDIADVQAANEGMKFTIEGIVTSNASGYDRDTAFFDCIYVQDDTAGINLFPVDGNIQAGQTIRVTGYTSSYNGERQLNVTGYTVKVTDSTVNSLPAPVVVSSQDINSGTYLGSLVTLTGTVESIVMAGGIPESIFVKDSQGNTARVFIDGYITTDKTIANLLAGCEITAIGLSSHDTEGYRIRIRNRDDIVCTASAGGGDDSGGTAQPPVGGGDTLPKPPAPSGPVEYNPNVPVRDNTITVTITDEVIKDIIKTALERKSDSVIIDPNSSGRYSKAVLEIELDHIDSLVDEAETDLTFSTDVGDITLPLSTLKELAGNSGEKLTIEIADLGSGTYELKVLIDGKPISRLDSGISLSISGSANLAVIVDGESETPIAKSMLDGGVITLVVNEGAVIKLIRAQSPVFTDVPASFWGYEGITFLSARGIMQGIGNNEFAPNGTMTRAMIVTMLHRLELETAAGAKSSFNDVNSNAYFSEAVDWAVEEGIVEGLSSTAFGPNENVTRAQLATMIFRYAKSIGLDVNARGNLSAYSDRGDIPSWSEDAMSWAVAVGLFKGYENGQIRPNGEATRAEAAILMYRLVELIVYGEISK